MTKITSSLRRFAARFLILPLVIAAWNGSPADAFDIAVGDANGPSYGLGIAVSSLIKVKLLPSADIDLHPVVTADDRASLEALVDGSVDFALVTVDGSQLAASRDLQAIAALGVEGSLARTLLTRSDVDDVSVQKILEAVFDNMDFLAAIDPKLVSLDPDEALIGLTLPLSAGAKGFYASQWASFQNAAVDDDDRSAPSHSPPTVSDTAADARNYVLYFGFDDDTPNDAGKATLREAATFAKTLEAPPAIIIASYTDSSGDAEYNYLLVDQV